MGSTSGAGWRWLAVDGGGNVAENAGNQGAIYRVGVVFLGAEERYDNTNKARFQILAPILGWLIPGFGHWSLGYRRRGRLIALGVLGIYLLGLLIGGVGVINRQTGFWWYCGQVFVGPATPIVDYWVAKHPEPADPADDPGYVYAVPSFAKVNEVGTLYTTLAGLLNLIAILDVIFKARGSRNQPRLNRRQEDLE